MSADSLLRVLPTAIMMVVPARRSLVRIKNVPRQASSTLRAVTLQDLVREIENAGTPFDLDPSRVSEKIQYSGDLWSCAGRDAYINASRQWAANMRDLLQAKLRVTRVAQIGPGEWVVGWQVMFVPGKLNWLWELGEAWPGVSNILYDILDRMGEISSFSWKGVFQLFKRAALQGEMRIPGALIKGTSMLRFGGEGGNASAPMLVSHKETVDLVSSVNNGEVRNKRICRDLLEFLEKRRPPGMPLQDWDDKVFDTVDVYSVPGMGVFDVDGLEDAGERNELYSDATAVLAFFTLVVLTFGMSVGLLYLQNLQYEAMLQNMIQSGAY